MNEDTKQEIAECLHRWGFLPSAIAPASEYYKPTDGAIQRAAENMVAFFQAEARLGTVEMSRSEYLGMLAQEPDYREMPKSYVETKAVCIAEGKR